jgi:hypothetical protein
MINGREKRGISNGTWQAGYETEKQATNTIRRNIFMHLHHTKNNWHIQFDSYIQDIKPIILF